MNFNLQSTTVNHIFLSFFYINTETFIIYVLLQFHPYISICCKFCNHIHLNFDLVAQQWTYKCILCLKKCILCLMCINYIWWITLMDFALLDLTFESRSYWAFARPRTVAAKACRMFHQSWSLLKLRLDLYPWGRLHGEMGKRWSNCRSTKEEAH